jgi:ribosome-binding protein aMBF1 (putative translation factor)
MRVEGLSQFNKQQFRQLFGLYVQEQRQQAGFSAKEIALKIGISHQTLKKIEAGTQCVSQNNFDKLREELNLDDQHIENLYRITFVDNLMGLTTILDTYASRE